MSNGRFIFASGELAFTFTANSPALQTVASGTLHHVPGNSSHIIQIEFTPTAGETLIWEVWPDGNDTVVGSTGIDLPGSVASVSQGGKTGRRHKYPDRDPGYHDDIYILPQQPLAGVEPPTGQEIAITWEESENAPLPLDEGIRPMALRVTIIH